MARRISAFFSSKDIKDEEQPRISNGSQLDESFNSPKQSPRGKLTKPMTMSPSDLHLNTRLDPDLEPPPVFTNSGISSRPATRDGRSPMRADTGGSRQSSSSRPQTPNMLTVPGTASPVNEQSPRSAKVNKRKSWIPGRSDKQTPVNTEQMQAQAWIAGLREQIPYDITKLLNGERVDDLWDDAGDVLVHIFPAAAEKGPSFRVGSQLFADSRLYPQLEAQPQGNNRLQGPFINLTPSSPMAALSIQDHFGRDYAPQSQQPNYAATQQELKSIYLPLELNTELDIPGAVPKGDDLELVVLYRNFFAFLCGGALVATQRQSSLYAIFMGISSILRRLQYGNEKNSSWGAVPWASFSRYTEELRLADVRSSREKNIEAIVLGEAMKSWPLYAEGFSHAVGRLEDIKSIKSPKYERISPVTIQRLERASHDLQRDRLLPLHAKLDSFDFPSMFSGLANSQTATESKLVSFKTWRLAFNEFRGFVLSHYKKKYGSWPPKASSKKNNFEESGLNRLLIREVYEDFLDLYQLLVDRTQLTKRTSDMPMPISTDAKTGSSEAIRHALRSVESEYDRATPPVVPPIPFDVPLIPAFSEHMLAREAQSSKKMKDSDLIDIIFSSYNRNDLKQTSFMQEYIEFERKSCHGKTVQDIADFRCGYWLFVYAVLQALPMTVVDARDLKYTEGAEHFLCIAPKGGRPWMIEDASTSRSWFNVASGGGLVSMPADTIDHSPEGIYRRSTCWTLANKWAEEIPNHNPVQPTQPSTYFRSQPRTASPYLVPSPHGPGSAIPSPMHSPLHSPSLQPVNLMPEDVPSGLPRISSRTSMNLGLEAVAAPASSNRPASQYNPNLTFDSILSTQQIEQKKGKKPKN